MHVYRTHLAIAHALYKQADVIIFDEATSALDNETEQAVMEAIESINSLYYCAQAYHG
ncbi:MAG: hypothetical protein WCI64_12370 [Chlorobium sp.]